jgi:chromosome segregation ATPase
VEAFDDDDRLSLDSDATDLDDLSVDFADDEEMSLDFDATTPPPSAEDHDQLAHKKLTAEIGEMKAQLMGAQRLRAAAERARETAERSLIDEKQSNQLQLIRLRDGLEEARSDTLALREELGTLNASLQETHSESERLRKTAKREKRRASEAEAELERLLQELAEVKASSSTGGNPGDGSGSPSTWELSRSLQEALSDSEAERERLRVELQHLKARGPNAAHGDDPGTRSLAQQAEIRLESANERIDLLQQEQVNLEHQLTEQRNAHERALHDLRAERDQLVRELNQERQALIHERDGLGLEVRLLRQESDTNAGESVERERAAVAELERAHTQIRSLEAQMQDETQRLNQQLEQSNSQLRDLTLQLETREREASEAEARLMKELEDRVESLTAVQAQEVASLQETLAGERRRREGAESNFRNAQLEMRQHRERAEAAEQRIATALAEAQREGERLREAEGHRLQATIEELEHGRNALATEIERLRASHESNGSELRDLRNALEAKTSEAMRMTNDLEELRNEHRREIEQRVAEERLLSANLASAVEQSQEKVARLHSEMETLRSKMNEQHAKQDVANRASDLEQQLDDERERLEQQLLEKDVIIEAERAKFQSELGRLQKLRDEANQRLRSERRAMTMESKEVDQQLELALRLRSEAEAAMQAAVQLVKERGLDARIGFASNPNVGIVDADGNVRPPKLPK